MLLYCLGIYAGGAKMSNLYNLYCCCDARGYKQGGAGQVLTARLGAWEVQILCLQVPTARLGAWEVRILCS